MTLDEARAMAEEALALHLEGLTEDGEAVPEPSTLETVMADRENRDGVAILVPVRSAAPRIVRVNITIAESVLDEIDAFAAARGLNRSGFLAAAAVDAMQRDAEAKAEAIIDRSRSTADELVAPTPTREQDGELKRSTGARKATARG